MNKIKEYFLKVKCNKNLTAEEYLNLDEDIKKVEILKV